MRITATTLAKAAPAAAFLLKDVGGAGLPLRQRRAPARSSWPTGSTRSLHWPRISPKTASSHIEHIYVKAGVSNRAQLSLFALKHGLMAGPQP